MHKEAIAQLLNETALLLELHGESSFKIQSYRRAAYQLDRNDMPESTFQSLPQLLKIPGIGPNLAQHINDIYTDGTFQVIETLRKNTPRGILELLTLKGLGPKKIRVIWFNLGIETKEALLEACHNNQISALPGFGEKTQTTIQKNIEFILKHKGMWLYAAVANLAEQLESAIKQHFPKTKSAIAGSIRRKLEIIEEAVLVLEDTEQQVISKWLHSIKAIQSPLHQTDSKTWNGKFIDVGLPLTIYFTSRKEFYKTLIQQTGSTQHLSYQTKNKQSLQYLLDQSTPSSENEFYKKAGMPFIEPELREGILEHELKVGAPHPLIEVKDLRGIFHVHTTYSDGKGSLREMAYQCKKLGYEYVGISDHSQTAFYAGGLSPNDLTIQHKEIDQLNEELAPFKVFKGIESDILPNGDLDYLPKVLDEFDFVIASIHSVLTMDKERATSRLIKAIENPYTTILGHATGRLLLRRLGYPIDHEAVIEACAKNGVIIEINANPNRLDMDWRWIPTGIARKVLFSINPDAHSTEGFQDVQFGVNVARKGGLTPLHTFNSLSREQITAFLKARKNRRQ